MEIRFESGGKEKSIFDTFDFELKSNIYVLLGAYSWFIAYALHFSRWEYVKDPNRVQVIWKNLFSS